MHAKLKKEFNSISLCQIKTNLFAWYMLEIQKILFNSKQILFPSSSKYAELKIEFKNHFKVFYVYLIWFYAVWIKSS